MKERLHLINCRCHGCMDGRPVLFKIQKVEGVWKIVISREAAGEVVEAKLPGGALGFVAVLQEVAHLSQERAIEVAEEALREMGMEPQLHLDNDHGHYDVEGKTDDELIQFVIEQTGGCGFAGLIWGEGAPALINMLKERGWLIEVLDGHHKEDDAKAIERKGSAINTAEATKDGHQSFTFNRKEARAAFEVMDSKLRPEEKVEGFVENAMEWHDAKFALIAKKLRNIDDVQSVE